MCTVRLCSLGITMFQFRLPLVTWNDLLLSLGSSLESLVYRDIQGWVSKSVKKTLKAVAMQPRGSVPCCNLPGDPVFLNRDIVTLKSQDESWHCTFKSRKEKTFNTKISHPSNSCICLCFPVSHASPLIVLPCEMFTRHPIHHSLLTV